MTSAVKGAVRNMLRLLRRNGRRAPETKMWSPVFEESCSRKVSAPVPWLCAVTDVGKRRTSNEDGYFLSPDCDLWVVADGLGGHAAGEVASTLTIQAIADVTGRAMPAAAVLMSPGESLMHAFAEAQERVLDRGRSDLGCNGMGSTAIAGAVHGDALHICHIGDTRGYHFSHGRLRRLTNDHSIVWSFVRAGILTPEQAREHPQRGRITQAIGMRGNIQPDVISVDLTSGDRVLLCSDGLWEALADADIATIVGQNGSMLELASTLVDKANASSGQDNITAVLYEH